MTERKVMAKCYLLCTTPQISRGGEETQNNPEELLKSNKRMFDITFKLSVQ